MGSNYTKEALYSAIDSSNEEWIMGILKVAKRIKSLNQ